MMTRHRSRIVLQITPAGWSNDANNESLSEAAYAEMMPDAPGLMPGNQSIFQGEGGGEWGVVVMSEEDTSSADV